MDIEKLKARFEQTECFKRLEHVAQYTFFEFGAYIKRTDVPADAEKKYGRFITALIFSWSAWKEAHQAVPEGGALLGATLDAVQKLGSGDFILVPRELSDEKADAQAALAWGCHVGLFKSLNRDMPAIQIEDFRLKWCRNKARDLQEEYKAMIEAQEQSHD